VGVELLPGAGVGRRDRARYGVSTNWLFVIFTDELMISALLGSRERRGLGNRMLAGANLLFALGLRWGWSG
jgi:hypothetical protein